MSTHFNGQLGTDSVGNTLHFSRFESQLRCAEIHVSLAVERNEVDVGVRHFEPDGCGSDAFARHGTAKGFGYAFSENFEGGKFVVVEVKQIIDLTFWNYQYVAGGDGVDVEKGVVFVVLGNSIRWYFAGSYA